MTNPNHTDTSRSGDLVARLRSVDVSWSETGEWCAEAADRIEALEAEVEWLTSLVSDLYDEDDCYHDHHGYCQAHGWFATEPTCPHKRAREVLGDFDQ